MGSKKKKPKSAAAAPRFRPMKDALSDLRSQLREQEAQPAKRSKTTKPAEPARRAPSVSKQQLEKKSYDERMALLRAYQGVRPLKSEQKVAAPPPVDPVERAGDEAARAKALRAVQRLVADGVRFVVEASDEAETVRAYRASAGKGALSPLKSGNAKPEASVDLHGYREEAARDMLQRWLRSERMRGSRVVRIVHGQGHHSAGGAVLKHAVHDELKNGLSAAYVDAYMTASQQQGGRGAVLVAVRKR